MIFVVYVLLAVCVIFFSARLGYYVDLMDQKTTLASAFIGGVLLAAVTSLPELVTSVTSVATIGKPELVLGNLLGSDLFNAAVLGLVFLLFGKALSSSKVTGSHKWTTLSVIVVYALLLCSLLLDNSFFLYGVSAISIVIFAFYVFSVSRMSGDEDTAAEKECVSPLSLKQVVSRFVFYSILLVIASVAITYTSDYIGEELGMGTTLAGALLLGIVTSLPEMISCFVLARLHNFNAMMGNIAGSNLFNFAILLVADIVYWNKNMYVYNEQSGLLIVLGLVSNLAVFTLARILTRDKRSRAFVTILNMIPVVSYVTFVALTA